MKSISRNLKSISREFGFEPSNHPHHTRFAPNARAKKTTGDSMTSSLFKGRSLAATPIHLAVMALVASLGTAHAQSTDAVPAAQQQAADSGAIPEVVVTATKRATPLQRTPVAITALNAATLQD